MGVLSPDRRVTQKDVARHAGVSTSIVSYVINDGPRSVSTETRARVLRAIEELGYRPNKYAQRLMRGQSEPEHAVRQMGIIIGGDSSIFTRPFYAAILSGIYAEAHRLNMRVRFLQFLDDLSDPILFNELIHPEEVSGLLLFAFDADSSGEPDKMATREATLQRVIERVDNVVCLERKWGNLPAVIFDRERAAHAAVSHLISLGHSRIGFLGALDDRLTGYQNAHYGHNLPCNECLVSDFVGGNSPADGYRQALQVMEAEVKPTAFFACSDEVALGAIGALDSLGLRVPDDVAIASVDDIEFADIYRPRLTSVYVPKKQMGAYAVRMLHDRSSQPLDPPVSVVLPTELIVRESCGARRTETVLERTI
jgi:LacI family transcriptional regulator